MTWEKKKDNSMSLIAKPVVVKQENNNSLLSFHPLLANYDMYHHNV